jgi:hypothetical protein
MVMHSSNPEYHLNTWDAGYAQIKLVWRKNFPAQFKDFSSAVKELREHLSPKVYEFGFLYE